MRWLDVASLPRSPVASAKWRLSRRSAAAGAVAVEVLVPSGELLSDWSELLEVSTQVIGQQVQLATLVASTEQHLRTREGNGRFVFEVLDETSDALLYSWSLTGSALVEDQFDVTLIRQQEGIVATVRYAARRQCTPELYGQAVGVVLAVPATPPVDVAVDEERGGRRYSESEIRELRGSLQRPLQALDQVEPRPYYRDLLAGVRRDSNPELWASLSALIGMQLLRSAFLPLEETLDVASTALRRALEVFDPDQNDRMWAGTVRSLATAYARQAVHVDPAYLAPAEYTLGAADQAFRGLGLTVDAALVWQMQANLRRIARPSDPDALPGVIDLLQRAGAVLEAHGQTLAWAGAEIDLGDAYLALADAIPEARAADGAGAHARATWQAVALRLTADDSVADKDGGAFVGALSDVDQRLVALDRRGLPEPTMRIPPGTKRRGEALYLRPLLSAGGLRFKNHFRNREALAVQFSVEPDPISLEAALYRVLGPHFQFTTIGGSVDGLGATRLFSIGGRGWQDQFHLVLGRAEVIVMVPEDSSGVRWELEQILAARRHAGCVFVFPPRSVDVDAAAMAEGGSHVLRDLGLRTPAYDPDGLLFRVRDDGSLGVIMGFEEVWDDTLADRL